MTKIGNALVPKGSLVPTPQGVAATLIIETLAELAAEHGEDALRWAWANTFGKKKKKPKQLAAGKGGGAGLVLLAAAVMASRSSKRGRRRR